MHPVTTPNVTGINVPISQAPKVPPMRRAVAISHRPRHPGLSFSSSSSLLLGAVYPRWSFVS